MTSKMCLWFDGVKKKATSQNAVTCPQLLSKPIQHNLNHMQYIVTVL